jgi:arylsulfatase A-like enzyme
MRGALPTFGLRAGLLLLAAACSSEPAPPAATLWDPCGASGEVFSEEGPPRRGRAHAVSRWFGRAEHERAGAPPEILGDSRDALFAEAPARWRVPVGEREAAARFTAGLLPTPRTHGARGHLVAELRWAGPDGSRLLTSAEIDPATERWSGLRAELPPGPRGELQLLTRWSGSGAPPEGLELAWGNPLIRPAEPAVGGGPDVLLVVIDTFRADALEQAPGVRELLDEGLLWPRAVAPSNWTLPSFASLFTAVPPGEHGAGRARGAGPRDYRGIRAVPTLAEAFRAAGYATGMVHQNPFLEPWTGLDRGFERYVRTREDTAVALAEASAWWEAADGRPRFLVLHLMAPHLPYAPPGAEDLGPDPLDALDLETFLSTDHPPEERRAFFDLAPADRAQVVRRYHAEVASLDRALTPWLRAKLSGTRPPLLAFTADHGEELWDDGSFEHGHSFHDSVVRVPLGLVWPGRLEAEARDEAVGLARLGPTLLRLAGAPLPAGWEDDLRDRSGAATTSSSYMPGAGFGRRFEVHGGSSRPLEAGEAGGATGPPAALDEELAEALRALGY